MLDLTRREVRENVYRQISQVLRSAPISYLKWDMNRPLVDVYSPSLPPRAAGGRRPTAMYWASMSSRSGW